MAINVATSFNVQTNLPIDERMVLSKAQMLDVNDNVMPQTYIATCTDDGKLYIYNKDNIVNTETGKFKIVESGGGNSVEIISSESEIPPESNKKVYIIKNTHETFDYSDLWVQKNGKYYLYIMFLPSITPVIKIEFEDGTIIDSASEWTNNICSVGSFSASRSVGSIRVKQEDTNSVLGWGSLYTYTSSQRCTFTIQSEQDYYYAMSDTDLSKGISIILPQMISDYYYLSQGILKSLDEDFSINATNIKANYVADTRTFTLLSSSANTYIPIFKIKTSNVTIDTPSQVFAMDVELATKEYVDENSGSGGTTIDDTTPATDKVYSSSKVNELVQNIYTHIGTADDGTVGCIWIE